MRERKCDITGQRQNSKAMSVSKFGNRNHKVQEVNLQWKKMWWEEGKKMVRLRLATRTIRTILKNGLHETAKKYDIDLNKFSISYGTGPPQYRKAYFTRFNGTFPTLKPRYAQYLRNEIKYNPTSVTKRLLPGYVPPPLRPDEPDISLFRRDIDEVKKDQEGSVKDYIFGKKEKQAADYGGLAGIKKKRRKKDRFDDEDEKKAGKGGKGGKGKVKKAGKGDWKKVGKGGGAGGKAGKGGGAKRGKK
jgi:large subunit ribosomal protein L28